MISHGIEISVVRGIAEMEDELNYVYFYFFMFIVLFIVSIGASRHKYAHPTVLGTTDCQASKAYVIQNLQLQSILRPLS